MKKSLFLICIVCLFCNSCTFQRETTTIIEGIAFDDSTSLPVENLAVVFTILEDEKSFSYLPPNKSNIVDDKYFKTGENGKYQATITTDRGIDAILVGLGGDSMDELGYLRFEYETNDLNIKVGAQNEVNFRMFGN